MLISNCGLVWISILFILDIRGGALGVVSRCVNVFQNHFRSMRGGGING